MPAVFVVQNRTCQALDLAGLVVPRWRQVEVPAERWEGPVKSAAMAAEANGLAWWTLVVMGRPVMRGNEAAAMSPVLQAPPEPEPEPRSPAQGVEVL